MPAVDPWTPGLLPAGPGGGSAAGDGAACWWDGRRWSYPELVATIDRVDVTGPVDATLLAPPEQLAGVFAAAAARVPVLIADPQNALPPNVFARATLGPETFLVASTSGSTGAPRAVLRTLRSWTSSFAGYTALSGLSTGDRLLLTGPLSSTLQLFAAVHALCTGATVTDDPLVATAAICVPAVLPRLLDSATGLRTVVVAGARLADPVARRAVSLGIQVAEYYGAAELSFVAARTWPGRWLPFPGVQVQIRDAEVWSRSEYQASGTLGSGGALRRDADGFATVGDLGRQQPDGTLHISGRGDTAVTVGGRTVIVEDVESVLTGIPGVLDAAAHGRRHERLGEELVAVVELAAGTELVTVRAAARQLLHGEWFPRRWRQAPTIPRTTGGKIDRAALRTQHPNDQRMITGGGTARRPRKASEAHPLDDEGALPQMSNGQHTTGRPPVRDRVAGAPISWGVCEVPGWGFQLSPEVVLGQMRDVGLAATEFGPEGFLPDSPVEKAATLARFSLAAVGQFVPAVLHDPAHDPLPEMERAMTALVTAAASTVVIAAATGAGGYDVRPALDERGWNTLLGNLDRIDRAAAAHGLLATLHPHVGTMIESGEQTQRVLDSSTVALCLDTGHLLIGGADPVAIARQYPRRIAHVHLKDVRLELAAQVRSGEISYTDAVASGIYVPLGTGEVDLAGILIALESNGYRGWYVLEQDTVLTGDPATDPRVADPLQDIRASVAHILAVAGSIPIASNVPADADSDV